MVVINVAATNCTPQTIVIGRRGTYDTMQIAFDLSFLIENYGSGTAVIAIKRSQDESAYPAVVTQEDSTLLWTVNETDTAYVGSGECQLMWYVDGGLAKTIIYPMVVMRDILTTAEEPPDGYENWIEHLTGLGAETQQNAQNAAQSATEAKESEDNAAESARKAEKAAGMLVDVSATATTLEPGEPATAEYDDGVFKFGIPKGTKGDKLTYADLTEADKDDLVQGPILEAQTSAVSAVGTAKTNAVNAVNQAGTTQVGNVTAEGNTQVGRVQDKGDEVINSIPSDYSDLTAEVDDLTRQLNDETTGLDTKAPVILETVSGAIASFSDGADSMPVKKLVAQIEPVQDLHGYEYPWPGGGGKNLCDPSTKTVPNIGDVRYYATNGFTFKAGITYTFSVTDVTIAPNGIYIVKQSNFSTLKSAYNVTSVTYTPSEDVVAAFRCLWNQSPTESIYANIKAQIEVGSSATSYAPYENICPISGWTGAEIEQTGKNLLRLDDFVQRDGFSNLVQSFEDGTITVTNVSVGGRFACWNIPVIVGKRYMISFGELINCGAVYVNTSDNKPTAWLGYGTSITNRQPYTPIKKWIQLTAEWNQAAGTTFFSVKDLQIEAGDFFTSYESPVSSSISVTFPETIYGGEDEVISGKLKKTMKTVDLATLNWTIVSPTYVRSNVLTDIKVPSSNSEPLNGLYSAGIIRQVNSSFNIGDLGCEQSKRLLIKVEDSASFSITGQLVYELAEPVEYTLTPQTLTTIYGTNNIWADTGNIEVTYPADTKLYIDNKITQAIANALNS